MSQRHIAVYLRVSTHTQASGLESQRRAIEHWLASNAKDMTVVEYSDFGISGAKAARPGLDKLMADVRAGLVSQVVVYSFSRMARSTTSLLASLETFKRYDVAFVSITERLDTTSGMGLAMFTILAALATLERDLIRERVINGLRNAKAKGRQLGRPRSYDPAIVAQLIQAGRSYRDIAKTLGVSVASVHRAAKSVTVPVRSVTSR
jgi:DNA invertase Pin-like site-specific DNA recombinase